MNAARWVLAGCVFAAFAALVLRGWWRVLPVFSCYCAASGIALLTHIRLELWFGQSWLTWNYVLLVLRSLAAGEIVVAASRGVSPRERAAAIGFASAVAAGFCALSWLPHRPDTVYYATASIMRQTEAALLLMIAGGLALLWRVGLPLRPILWHALIFAALMMNQIWTAMARPSTGILWRQQHAAYLAVSISCAAAWVIFAVRCSPRAASSRRPRGERP